jgi:hypothetical protein
MPGEGSCQGNIIARRRADRIRYAALQEVEDRLGLSLRAAVHALHFVPETDVEFERAKPNEARQTGSDTPNGDRRCYPICTGLARRFSRGLIR